MAKSPAYPWYPGDALSSERMQSMSLAQQGAYRRLLDYQWLNGSIPESILGLARLCNVHVNRMRSLWGGISGAFVAASEPGRLINLKLEGIRQEQVAFKKGRSEAGKKGMRSRYRKPNSVITELLPSPSPSPSPSEKSANIEKELSDSSLV